MGQDWAEVMHCCTPQASTLGSCGAAIGVLRQCTVCTRGLLTTLSQAPNTSCMGLPPHHPPFTQGAWACNYLPFPLDQPCPCGAILLCAPRLQRSCGRARKARATMRLSRVLLQCFELPPQRGWWPWVWSGNAGQGHPWVCTQARRRSSVHNVPAAPTTRAPVSVSSWHLHQRGLCKPRGSSLSVLPWGCSWARRRRVCVAQVVQPLLHR